MGRLARRCLCATVKVLSLGRQGGDDSVRSGSYGRAAVVGMWGGSVHGSEVQMQVVPHLNLGDSCGQQRAHIRRTEDVVARKKGFACGHVGPGPAHMLKPQHPKYSKNTYEQFRNAFPPETRSGAGSSSPAT